MRRLILAAILAVVVILPAQAEYQMGVLFGEAVVNAGTTNPRNPGVTSQENYDNVATITHWEMVPFLLPCQKPMVFVVEIDKASIGNDFQGIPLQAWADALAEEQKARYMSLGDSTNVLFLENAVAKRGWLVHKTILTIAGATETVRFSSEDEVGSDRSDRHRSEGRETQQSTEEGQTTLRLYLEAKPKIIESIIIDGESADKLVAVPMMTPNKGESHRIGNDRKSSTSNSSYYSCKYYSTSRSEYHASSSSSQRDPKFLMMLRKTPMVQYIAGATTWATSNAMAQKFSPYRTNTPVQKGPVGMIPCEE